MTRCCGAASRFTYLLNMDHQSRDPHECTMRMEDTMPACCQMSLGNESEDNFHAKAFVMTSHSQDCLVT